MGLHSRRRAVYPYFTLLIPVLDRHFDSDHRGYSRLGVLRHLVYAQELIPGKVGMVSGLFFGFAFGMGGLGAAVLGYVADLTSIELVYQICAFLPLIGIITALLPNMEHKAQ